MNKDSDETFLTFALFNYSISA